MAILRLRRCKTVVIDVGVVTQFSQTGSIMSVDKMLFQSRTIAVFDFFDLTMHTTREPEHRDPFILELYY